MKKEPNQTNTRGNELNPVLGTVINPLYVVRLDDDTGYKGSCWYYNVKASSEEDAIQKMKSFREKFKQREDKYFSAFIPKNQEEYIEGHIIYFEGDPRL